MKTLDKLIARSGNQCELCEAKSSLPIYDVPPTASNLSDREILVCETCLNQIEKKEELDANHWQSLSTAMWNENLPVQVVSWRMLNRFRNDRWNNRSRNCFNNSLVISNFFF